MKRFLPFILAGLLTGAANAAPNDICFPALDQGYCYAPGDGGPPCPTFRLLRKNTQEYCCQPELDCCFDAAACSSSTGDCTCDLDGIFVTAEAPCFDSDILPTPPVGWFYHVIPYIPLSCIDGVWIQ